MKIVLRLDQYRRISQQLLNQSLPMFSVDRCTHADYTRGSAMAEGLRNVLVSRNSATTKYPYRMALFA